MSKAFNTQNFISLFTQYLPFTPTSDQEEVIRKLSDFIGSQSSRDIFVLKGYAGTGKTNLVSTLAQVLPSFKWRSVLLAPTGRAAKVLSLYAKRPAQTIHKKIFRKMMGADGGMQFSLGENLHKNTIFIVDEASMIGMDSSNSNSLHDSLLESLMEYVFSGDNCKLLLVGDSAQLPPVGSNESPALDLQFLKSAYHMDMSSYELKQVARQGQESGILKNATDLRKILTEDNEEVTIPKLGLYPDVIRLHGDELQDAINNAYSKYGYENVLIVTRSNKRANLFNQSVRARVRYMEEDISTSDLLMVVKNNYFWLDEKSDIGFIANGDAMEIKKILGRQEIYGFTFLECVVGLLDYPQLPDMQVKLIMESVYSETSSLTEVQQRQLYEQVMMDMADEPIKGRRAAYLRQSPFYNALQAKFCYAVTCHKAQGGQWPVVFIDQGYLTKELIDKNFLRWLYTAFTRATDTVYLINFSEDFF
jgi:exodeoxyribonuclease V